MTKPLLTSKDIKNFILSEIDKIDTRKYGCYTLIALSKMLHLSKHRLEYYTQNIEPTYIKNDREYYNIEQVIDCLNKNDVEYNYAYKRID